MNKKQFDIANEKYKFKLVKWNEFRDNLFFNLGSGNYVIIEPEYEVDVAIDKNMVIWLIVKLDNNKSQRHKVTVSEERPREITIREIKNLKKMLKEFNKFEKLKGKYGDNKING